LIDAGKVSIDGMPAVKPSTAVAVTAALRVASAADYCWVSRGAHKLIGALDTFGISVAGRRCLDAGASTGGFTEVLLDRGAREVVAVDVGYGQLAWSLRSDARVVVIERTNARELSPDVIGGPVDVIVADLSFISLTTVLSALTGCASDNADMVPMVKPQFEVGRGQVGPGGVVRDPEQRAGAVLSVARRAEQLGWHTVGVTASPLPGPSGNIEYFLWLRAETDRAFSADELTGAVHDAVAGQSEAGPAPPMSLRAPQGRGGSTPAALGAPPSREAARGTARGRGGLLGGESQ